MVYQFTAFRLLQGALSLSVLLTVGASKEKCDIDKDFPCFSSEYYSCPCSFGQCCHEDYPVCVYDDQSNETYCETDNSAAAAALAWILSVVGFCVVLAACCLCRPCPGYKWRMQRMERIKDSGRQSRLGGLWAQPMAQPVAYPLQNSNPQQQYPTAQPAYNPPPQGFAPHDQGSYPPPQGQPSYPPQQQPYPPQGGMYPPQNESSYPPQGYAGQQPAYNPNY
eukprot:Rmarinus@m.24793